MVRTVFGIAGLIGGIVLAGRYYDELAALLFPSGAIWGNIAAYAIIVIATLVVAGLIGWLLAKLVNFAALGWLDKFMGFILGVVIGGLLFAAILAIVLHFADYYPGMEATINQSAIGRFLVTAFPLRY
jgi:membrane protein required for colicin V production